jgi:hypothetical protein
MGYPKWIFVSHRSYRQVGQITLILNPQLQRRGEREKNQERFFVLQGVVPSRLSAPLVISLKRVEHLTSPLARSGPE